MLPTRIAVVFLSLSLLLSGCYLRKSEEDFPDEFAQGLESTDTSKIDYVEMDDSQETLEFDEDAGDLIASADPNPLAQDDISPPTKSSEKSGSIWDAPKTSSAWDNSAENTMAVESPDIDSGQTTGIAGGVVAGPPIGGGAVPSGNPSTTDSSNQGTPSMDDPIFFDSDPSTGGEAPSGLQLNDPPKMLANSNLDATYREGNQPFSLNTGRPAPGTGGLSLDSAGDSLSSVQKDLDQQVDAMIAPRFEGSRAAQAIGSTPTLGTDVADTALSDSAEAEVNQIPLNRNISIDGTKSPSQPTAVGNPPEGGAAPLAASPAKDLPDPKTLKKQGIDFYHERNFGAAITTFRDYLSAYTEEEDAVRAWLGYALMQDRRYGEASKEFTTLLNSDNPELRADAHFYLGSIHDKQGEFEAAKVRWEQVVESYPNTKAAEKARKSLGLTTP